MKIALRNLRNILREEVESFSEEEKNKKSSKKEPLGRYAFPGERNPRSGPALPHEKNTKLEDDIYDSLVNYVVHNDTIPPDLASSIHDILKSGMYDDIFAEPDASTKVYRGSGTGNSLKKILGLGPDDPIPSKGESDVDYVLSARKGSVTSWSLDPEIASKFAQDNNTRKKEDDYTVIMTAVVGENPGVFWVGPGGFYKLKTADKYSKESEAMALGPVKLSHVSWFSNKFINQRKDPEVRKDFYLRLAELFNKSAKSAGAKVYDPKLWFEPGYTNTLENDLSLYGKYYYDPDNNIFIVEIAPPSFTKRPPVGVRLVPSDLNMGNLEMGSLEDLRDYFAANILEGNDHVAWSPSDLKSDVARDVLSKVKKVKSESFSLQMGLLRRLIREAAELTKKKSR